MQLAAKGPCRMQVCSVRVWVRQQRAKHKPIILNRTGRYMYLRPATSYIHGRVTVQEREWQ